MAYNSTNRKLRDRNVIEIVKREFDPDTMTYAKFWRARIFPIYPIGYQSFLKIVNTPQTGFKDLKPTTSRLNKTNQ